MNEITDEIAAQMARIAADPRNDVIAARARAEQQPAELFTVPLPDFMPGGGVRFGCPFGCGWHHDENPGHEAVGPLRLPVDYTADDVSAAITAAASARAEALQNRLESRLTGHYADAHPDATPEDVSAAILDRYESARTGW